MENTKRPKTITIFDVAKEADVSYSTVSRVVNNYEFVKPETRQRVEAAMARLGYVANPQARSLAGGASKVIGLLVHGLDNSYITEIIRGIDSECAKADYDLMLYTTHRNKGKESAYVATLTRGMADGLLLVLPRNPEAYFAVLQEQEFPYVLVDHQGLGTDSSAVGTTNWQGAFDATEYLIQLGHREIGFITGSMDLGVAQDRYEGYKAAMTRYEIPFRSEYIGDGDFRKEGGYDATNVFLTLPKPPTAIFASNDISAFGAMEAILEHGLRIPQDISLIGFDNIPQTTLVYPHLTTVHQPLEDMGRVATQMLLSYLKEHTRSYRRVTLATRLVIRQSCQPPKKQP